MIGRYTKKPVNIEAIQYAGDDNQAEIVKWGNGNIYPVNVGYGTSLHCKTLEGDLIISVGDWIIKGVKGEYYPCRDDIFKLTYQCQHINKVPATDPKFDWKCQDCKEKFNEIPNIKEPTDLTTKEAKFLEELPRIIEKVRWIRAAQVINNEKSQSVKEFTDELTTAITAYLKGEK